MSSAWSRDLTAPSLVVPMTVARLDAVMAIEREAYPVPWTRGNFVDALASGYLARCLLDARRVMLGYCVALRGAGVLHLLNLTVAPAREGRGHARHMLDMLLADGREHGLAELWLEVRAGNARARRLYERYGFVESGLRKAYYPTPATGRSSEREDAVVMSMQLGKEA